MHLTLQRVALINNLCLVVMQLMLIVGLGVCICGMIEISGIAELIARFWITYLAMLCVTISLLVAVHRWIAKRDVLGQLQRYERVK
jgi:hypothetical protein